jgi:beta-ribofuranosylaminobenzene 5'-phosphate synthase
MNGTIGRIDGGAGITLEQPGFEFEITGSDTCMITSHDPVVRSRLQSILDGLKNNGLSFPPVHIHVKQSIPFHYGLGSGTQAALGIAAGIIAHTDQKIREDDLIRLSGRGGTSGIGVRSFFRGGLIVDAGHRFGHGKKKQNFAPSSISSGAGIAPLVGRYDIPKDWSFVLAIPEGFSNIHGSIEQSIFQSCCPVRLHDVQTLSHILVMKLIPSVIEEDLEQFGEAINEFQNYGFKQCEIALQPPVILEIMDAMKNAGAAGVGMSSFGPTIYAVCDSKISSISSAAQNCMNEWNGGEIICTKGSNCGAMILKNENEFIQVS